MRRRKFIALIGGAAAAWPLAARAQEAGRTYRLGMLWPFPRHAGTGTDHGVIAFIDALREEGFVEGQNLAIDYRAWAPHPELTSDYAAQMVKVGVDAIAAGGDMAIRAAQQATKEIPILGSTDDMVGAGLVSSMARPGGNTTGVSILATELDGKRQEILIEALPGLRKLASLVDANSVAVTQLDSLRAAAHERNVELSIHPIARGEDIAGAIDTAKSSGATALNVLASPMLDAHRAIILNRTAALQLPAIYQWPEAAEEGGFAAYGPRFSQVFRDLAARQLVQILRGVKPVNIPVEQPTKFELVFNLKAAKALGVTVPSAMLTRADKVIE